MRLPPSILSAKTLTPLSACVLAVVATWNVRDRMATAQQDMAAQIATMDRRLAVIESQLHDLRGDLRARQ